MFTVLLGVYLVIGLSLAIFCLCDAKDALEVLLSLSLLGLWPLWLMAGAVMAIQEKYRDKRTERRIQYLTFFDFLFKAKMIHATTLYETSRRLRK